jgi:hypothetical protein
VAVHGIILSELHKFLVEQQGADTWRHVVQRARLPELTFTPLEFYPDEYLARIVAATEGIINVSPWTLLENFGEHLTPRLLALYEVLLEPSWRTLDVIEHTEQTVHRLVRMRDPAATPPRLRAERTGPNEVVLTYDSPRRLCAIARGIGKGIARHFGEELVLTERACMLCGDPTCVLVFEVVLAPERSGSSSERERSL